MKTTLQVFFLIVAAATGFADTAPHVIHLDAASPGRVFEGIGAVSAGASTRLLPDYPEPQRSQILDFLFKPKFGAGFQHLKVEIGSGENSTCGSEPSHVVTREELADPKPRGYEFWLMAEARKRNPQIILDCLPWAYPHWVGNRFSQESADWFVSFLEVARKHYGLELEWIAAAQNEMGTDLNWIRKNLRPTLDARGFTRVKLQAPDDDSEFWQVFDALEKDPELDRLIGAVGYHYVDGREPWDIDQKGRRDATEKAKRSGKPLWASEEWSQSGKEWGGKGALYLARLMNKLYTRDRIAKYQIWCPIDSIYDQIIWADTGAMQADTPWCGHYTVWPAVWALAHTTQFAEPGWVYLDGACGQLDTNTWRGSHVALRDPKTGDWSVIVVTGEKRTVRLTLAPGLKTGPVHVWKSTEAAQFVQQPALALRDNTAELELEPNAIYTFTSTAGQQKGSHGTPPPRKPFPLPFAEDFESYHPGDTPRFLSDQKGTFEVARWPNGGLCLAQVVPAQGILWYDHWLLKPHTLFGHTNWGDGVIEADVLLAGGDVEIGGRYASRDKLGYRWILTRDGRWQLNWQYTTLAAGQVDKFNPTAWHHLRLEMAADQITGHVDGKKLAAVTNASRAKGMAFLASTYDRNLFDNVRVGPLASTAAANAPQTPSKPNILFLFTDDQRHDTIHALGNDVIRTPNMDRLARDGVAFRNAYIMGGSSPAVCSPSRACLFTGRTLWNIECQSLYGFEMSERFKTLPQVFRENGYITFGTGKNEPGRDGAFGRSFSAGDKILFRGMTKSQYSLPLCAFSPAGRYPNGSEALHEGKHSAVVYADACIRFLEGQAINPQPFFAYVAFQTPHDPRQCPPEFRAMYTDEQMKLPGSFMPRHPFDNGMLDIRDEKLAPFPRTESVIRKHLADYYASITHTDAQIGRILDALEKSGKRANTIVVFSSDNGLAMGSHGLMGKQNLYDDSVHVPLIIAGPGIPEGATRDALCYIYDIYPTLCERAGLKTPDTVQFQSLNPVICDTAAKARDHLYYAFMSWQRSVRDEQYKLIEYCVDRERHTQLFDLQNDPQEIRNLAADAAHAGTLARLRALLQEDRVRFNDGNTPFETACQQGKDFWSAYESPSGHRQ